MTAKKIFLYLCISVISIVMLSCSRTVEIDEVNIRNYFSSFPVEAQNIIAQGNFVVKTVSGMPSHSVLVGVSSYDNSVQEHVATFEFLDSIEGFANGRMSTEAQVPSLLTGYNYSIQEFEARFGLEIDDWSSYLMTYAHFNAAARKRLHGLILSSSEDNIAVYMLWIDYDVTEKDEHIFNE